MRLALMLIGTVSLLITGCGGGSATAPTGPAGTVSQANATTAVAAGGSMQNASQTADPTKAGDGTSLAPGSGVPGRFVMGLLPANVRNAFAKAQRSREFFNCTPAGVKAGGATDADLDGLHADGASITFTNCAGSFRDGDRPTTATYKVNGKLTEKDNDDTKKGILGGLLFTMENLGAEITFTTTRNDPRATIGVTWTGNASYGSTPTATTFANDANARFAYTYTAGGQTASGNVEYWMKSVQTPTNMTTPWLAGSITMDGYYVAKYSSVFDYTVSIKNEGTLTYAGNEPNFKDGRLVEDRARCPYYFKDGIVRIQDGSNNKIDLTFTNCKYVVTYNGTTIYNSP